MRDPERTPGYKDYTDEPNKREDTTPMRSTADWEYESTDWDSLKDVPFAGSREYAEEQECEMGYE